MAITIRPATPADAAEIAQLHAETHRATYAPLIDGPYQAPALADRQAEWREMLAGPGLSFVAIEAGRIVGIGHAEGARIEPLNVVPSHHQRGIGQALLRRLLDGLSARGEPFAIFNVLAANGPAIAFYEAQGAHRIGSETMTDAPAPYLDFVYRIDAAAR